MCSMCHQKQSAETNKPKRKRKIPMKQKFKTQQNAKDQSKSIHGIEGKTKLIINHHKFARVHRYAVI